MNDINKQKQEFLSIPKKALFGIAPAVAIIGVYYQKETLVPYFYFL